MRCLWSWLFGTGLSFVASIAAAAAPASTPAAEQAIADSVSAALQGDVRRSLQALGTVPAEQFVGRDADYRACLFGRFERSAPPYLAGSVPDAFAREALTMYQDYWWHALSEPSRREALDAQLLRRLRGLFGSAAAAEDWDAVETRLSERLGEHGYHAQLGRTPPLRELMMWRKQTTQAYDVALPEGSHHVEVELLDDFVTLGWSEYARCSRGSNGGWASGERLYAVAPWFEGDLHSDLFRASLLGHETQHFADLKRFPALEPWELEYRAKFTELWTSRTTLRKLLTKFAASQSDNKDSPHTYANRRVLNALRERLQKDGITAAQPDLGDAPADAVRVAAREVLLEDSRKRAGS